jgi:hypothetical protein
MVKKPTFPELSPPSPSGSQFPEDGGGNGSRNVGFFTIKLSNKADRPRIFYPV